MVNRETEQLQVIWIRFECDYLNGMTLAQCEPRVMTVVCSYVIKELFAFTLVKEVHDLKNNLLISGSCRCLAQRMEAWVRV